MQQINESFETARLTQDLERDPYLLFVDAVRRYEHSGSHQRVRLLEGVIWTSRNGPKDDRMLPPDVREALCAIRDRYQLFASPEEGIDPVTYRGARMMIANLFF